MRPRQFALKAVIRMRWLCPIYLQAHDSLNFTGIKPHDKSSPSLRYQRRLRANPRSQLDEISRDYLTIEATLSYILTLEESSMSVDISSNLHFTSFSNFLHAKTLVSFFSNNGFIFLQPFHLWSYIK